MGTILRNISFFLDKIVYGIIGWLFELFFNISNIAVLNPDMIEEFSNRVYVLIGIIMLFKISVSLIQWFASPDTMTDKKGAGDLLKRIAISLVLLAITPTIFTYAYKIQIIVLEDNIIGNVIMGGTGSNPEFTDKDKVGQALAIGVFQGFFNPSGTDEATWNEYNTQMSGNNAWGFVDRNLTAKSGSEYKYEYTSFISTIAGIFVALIVLNFCIDIAIRSVKLAFLQLIAPIPILSYIDPKGQKTFDNWVKSCTSTYISLFLKLMIIYFAVYLIGEVCSQGLNFYEYTLDGDVVKVVPVAGKLFTRALIIIGILMFAKEVPNMISEIFGIKVGGFELNPLKKIGASPFAAAAGGLVGGALGGLASNALALGNQIKKDGWKKGLTDGFDGKRGVAHAVGNIFSPLAGGVSASLRGAYSGATSGGKGSLFSGAAAGIKASNQARFNRDVYAGNPQIPGSRYGFIQRRIDDINKFAGIKNKDAGIGHYDKEMKSLTKKMEDYSAQEQSLRDALARYATESAYSFNDFNADDLYKYDANGKKVEDASGNYVYLDFSEYKGKLDRSNFDKFKSFQEGIDQLNKKHEDARKLYGQYEDAYKSRNSADKK